MQYFFMVIEKESLTCERKILFRLELYFLSEFYSIFAVSATKTVVIDASFKPIRIIKFDLFSCLKWSSSTWKWISSRNPLP